MEILHQEAKHTPPTQNHYDHPILYLHETPGLRYNTVIQIHVNIRNKFLKHKKTFTCVNDSIIVYSRDVKREPVNQ